MKEGKLSKVPQSQCICDGIWPPELVPLFIKDGAFPIFVDSEKESPKLRMRYSGVNVKRNSVCPNILLFFNIPVLFPSFAINYLKLIDYLINELK